MWGLTWSVLPLVAAVALLATDRRVVGVWTIVVWLLFAQPRFAYAAGSIAVVALVVELAKLRETEQVVRSVYRGDGSGATVTRDRLDVDVSRAVLAALVVVSVVGLSGLGYAFAGASDGTTPEFVDSADVAAMEWAATETPTNATFVVFGDAAEWFPVVADRTILVSPWGAEWRGPDTYQPHLDAFVSGSECENASCAEQAMAAVDARPDYVYLPRDGYTVRGDHQWADGSLRRSIGNSSRYERAFENDGVVIYRRVSASGR
jgi:hypothetical protein